MTPVRHQPAFALLSHRGTHVTPAPLHCAIQWLVRGSAMIWLCQQKYSAAIQASHLYQTIVTQISVGQHCASRAPSHWDNTGIQPAMRQHRTCMTTMWHNVTPALHLLCSCRIRATPQFRQSLALCWNRTNIVFILFSSVGSEHHTIGTVSQRLGLDCALTRFWQHSDRAGTVLL